MLEGPPSIIFLVVALTLETGGKKKRQNSQNKTPKMIFLATRFENNPYVKELFEGF